MGWGDELMAAGQARRIQLENPKAGKVIIRDRNGNIRQHEAWNDNPRILKRSEAPGRTAVSIVNGPSVRPYIADKSEMKWTWNEWECPVGEIYFSDLELKFAEAYSPQVVIEPNNKAKASPNKDWGIERWAGLVHLLKKAGLESVQLGPRGTRVIDGAALIETPTIRLACAVLAKAKVAVLPEGGLHHAAAALSVPTVVIFGGFISPKQTGYATQTNLFTGGKPCGMRQNCPHCKIAMAAITPEMVFDEAMKLLKTEA